MVWWEVFNLDGLLTPPKSRFDHFIYFSSSSFLDYSAQVSQERDLLLICFESLRRLIYPLLKKKKYWQSMWILSISLDIFDKYEGTKSFFLFLIFL